MLSRLLDAAGERLLVSSDASQAPVDLARLTDAWHEAKQRPDWTRLRVALDHLHEHPEHVAAAIERSPARTGHQVLDALLAGIADKLADDHDLPRPRWTAHRKLRVMWSPPATPRQHARHLEHAPPQLREHNIAVDAESPWRKPPVDA